jgi:hypothetical protein
VTHPTIASWQRGDTTPAPGPQRDRLLAELGIAIDAWDRKAPVSGFALPPAPPAIDDEAPLPQSAEGLDDLIRQLRAARSAPDVTPATLARLASVEARAVVAKAQLADISAQAWAHPAWQVTLERCARALAPQPLALEALMAALGPPPSRPIRDDFPALVAAVEAANAALVAACKAAGATRPGTAEAAG